MCVSDGAAAPCIVPAAVPWATVSSWLTRVPREGHEPSSRVAELPFHVACGVEENS